jgi:hypothetical protein
MEGPGPVERIAFRALRDVAVKSSNGFTYIELLISFSLTVLILATVVPVIGAITREAEQNVDHVVLQREASALHFLLLNEMKQGYHFRVMGGDLYFQLDDARTVQLEHRQGQLGRRLSKRGAQGPFEGYILLSRHIDHIDYHLDEDGNGVTIRVLYKKGDAAMTLETHWRSRIEREGG